MQHGSVMVDWIRGRARPRSSSACGEPPRTLGRNWEGLRAPASDAARQRQRRSQDMRRMAPGVREVLLPTRTDWLYEE